MKKVLITGAGSYIGTSFEHYLTEHYPGMYDVCTVDMRSDGWRNMAFRGYDVVFHVAGIAHIKETDENAELYYKVNRDLTVECAKKALSEQVPHFVFLSSMSVYGMNSGRIIKETEPSPTTNYGKSKLEAENDLNILANQFPNTFTVAILRPPMIYGKGCKGNYNALKKIALSVPLFPDIINRRSMLYIDNLCEFVRRIIDKKGSGLFFPQNNYYMNTTQLADTICNCHGRRLHKTKLFNPIISAMSKRVCLIEKAFGSLTYVSNAKNNSLLPEGYYLFKDNHAMANNEFGLWQNSLCYIRNGQPCFAGLILNEDGKIIYIGSDCMLGKGTCTVSAGKTNGLLPEGTYAFGEDGVLVDNAFAMWQGNMCYMRNGQPYAAGLVRIGEDIYYIRSNCQAATGMYWAAANKTNGILEEGFYLFHNDGTLIDGEFADWKGENCYIVMGRPYFAGVIEYNGKTIYVGSDCKLNTGVCYVTDAAGNGILSEGYYYFTESGELLASGFAKWTDGVTYYFRNGQRTAAGVIELDGSIYYVNSGCRPVTGKYFVPANKGNGILEEGYYTFDSNGKLIQN